MTRGERGRYSLLPHHSEEYLFKMGLSEEMIEDQKWQMRSSPSDLNTDWPTSGPNFFRTFVPTDLNGAVGAGGEANGNGNGNGSAGKEDGLAAAGR